MLLQALIGCETKILEVSPVKHIKTMIMKTTVFIFTAVTCFFLGYTFCSHFNGVTYYHKVSIFKNELIKAQAEELDYAGKLINKHNLYDADDSELMDNYLHSQSIVDSLYANPM